MSFLSAILEAKRAEVRRARRRVPEAILAASPRPARRDFSASLRQEGLSVIAEVKRASPSRGPLAPDLDLGWLVSRYEAGGAAAVSVLTDGRFFAGSLADLRAIRELTSLPLLRKDFLIDPYQVVEAAAAGADAVLLIVACLSAPQLSELLAAAEEQGLAALVEVHTPAELQTAVAAGARIVGLNNRDLHTFAVDPGTTLRLLPEVPRGCLVVAESGLRQPEEAAALARAGVDAVLVGEALVKSPDPAGLIRAFRLSAARRSAGQVPAGEGDREHVC
ncbi:MAG: indole-3-glycerol phosphate synthase TrpC [Bacillota bacterium]|nr:indole-3-glycerol phosphate synthase TrpC [Bacillota bacterium]